MADQNYRRILSADSLDRDDVCNEAGEKIGKIESIMIDVEVGNVAYAVLSFGGFLGMGDKLFAIPWKALKVDEANKRFIFNAKKETLEKGKGFDKNNWPDVSDPSFRSQVYSHYGIDPYWEEKRAGQRAA